MFASKKLYYYNLPDIWAIQHKEENLEGDPTDGHRGDVTCTDRWRAANADAKKCLKKPFEETGIFLSTCRHGIIWTIVDMLHSGEL